MLLVRLGTRAAQKDQSSRTFQNEGSQSPGQGLGACSPAAGLDIGLEGLGPQPTTCVQVLSLAFGVEVLKKGLHLKATKFGILGPGS